ncbi:MAG: hypothetical protein HQM10_19455 [Candidatus Riflebacteria bacterium]|nr:hypothetical protein [Candidatus Riflebacteria bacterium]
MFFRNNYRVLFSAFLLLAFVAGITSSCFAMSYEEQKLREELAMVNKNLKRAHESMKKAKESGNDSDMHDSWERISELQEQRERILERLKQITGNPNP